MQVLYPRCAGLAVHKETVVACVRLLEASGVVTEVDTFATTTAGLMELSEWLSQHGCTHAAMEATGVYWKPVWHVLEDGEFKLIKLYQLEAYHESGLVDFPNPDYVAYAKACGADGFRVKSLAEF